MEFKLTGNQYMASKEKDERGKRPTIRDVARAAGVSIGTVSAVVNRAEKVTEETRQRVLRSIAELGYEPNIAARSLKRQRASSIGIIIPDLQNPFFAAVAEGAHTAARKSDVFIVLVTTGRDSHWEEYYCSSLRARRLDGMIVLSGSGRPNIGLVKLVESGSVVFVDECIPGLDAPFVSAANRKGARLVAGELLHNGHRKLAIVGGPSWLWTSDQRLAGYREACAGAGIDPDSIPVVHGDYTEKSGYEATAALLESQSETQFTGIIYANDLMAIGGARFLSENGISIPNDISIVGFDDIILSRYLSPPLTTVSQPGFEMGQAAAQLLLHKIGLADPPEKVTFPTELKRRQSVARLDRARPKPVRARRK